MITTPPDSSQILPAPIVQFLPDGRNVRVLREEMWVDPRGRTWILPALFESDGASIPQPLWNTIGSPYTGHYRVAALFHDAAYANGQITKDDADTMFRELAMACGCTELEAETIYQAVHLFGAGAYQHDQDVTKANDGDEVKASETLTGSGVAPDSPLA